MSEDFVEAEQLDSDLGLPTFRGWNSSELYKYDDYADIDFATLEDYNRALNAARMAMFKLTERQNAMERRERAARLEYERAHRREYLSSTEKTESAKKARADLKCEELENKALVLEQLNKELQRFSFTLRQELQALQIIGNNLRQQLRM